MAGITEVGSSDVQVRCYKCSIKKITASTKWKAPGSEVSETVTSTVYENQQKAEKTIYLISSPEGEKVTVRIEQEKGGCHRKDHKNYHRVWEDYIVDKSKDVSFRPRIKQAPSVFDPGFPFYPYVMKTELQKEDGQIKDEEELTIKCFEIGGLKNVFDYVTFPVPIDKDYLTTFRYASCKEGPIHFQVISYPDISFKVEATIGTNAKKNKNKTSKFEKKTGDIKRVPVQLKEISNNSLGVGLSFTPSLSLSTTYNGGKSEVELTFEIGADKEFGHFRYKDDNYEEEYGTELIQEVYKEIKHSSGFLKTISDLLALIQKVCNADFLNELKQFDAKSLVSNYKPYKLKLNSPSVLCSYEGKYQTSKDLTRIGKYIDICLAAEPLIGISFTVDLLFLIISGVTAGTGTGFYVMLKNLDKVIGKILGDGYRTKYKDTKPFDADVYFDLVITGDINGNVHLMIDTTEQRDERSTSQSIEGVLKVDLKAGAKCSMDIFYVAVEGEASISGSTGIKIRLVMENHMLQGRGLLYIMDGYFLGIRVKYCVRGKVGLMKIKSYGRSLVDGEQKLMDKTQLFSKQWQLFAEKNNVIEPAIKK